MTDINDCIALVERELSPTRLEHSLGVMQVMSELASIYALDESVAMTCGILHDVAKEFPLDRQLDVAREKNIPLSSEYDQHPLFLHGPVGACYIVDELGITDPVILDAIVHHSYFSETTALSPVLCWCLRFADILEPTRNWMNIKEQLRPAVYSGNVKEGAYQLIRWAISFHESMSIPVHTNMHRVSQELSLLMDGKSSNGMEVLPV